MVLQERRAAGKCGITPIALMGVNPHAGEGGLLGKEEVLLREVVGEFQGRGVLIEGPLPADSGFRAVYEGRYGVVVATYHDQGLIPMKMLSGGRSVNLTMGLPFVRTSVDHGTAYDIAGGYTANALSLYCAIREAVGWL